MKRLISILCIVGVVLTVGATVYAAKGRLRLAGSTTVLPVAQRWAEEYMKKNPDASISVSGGGTGTGLSMLLNGTCDIADASREAKKKEIDSAKARNSKLVATKLAKDGIAVIVHPSNTAKNLTMDQIKAVYSGKATNWKDLGGASAGIVVIGRDSTSGTYGFFQETVLGGGRYVTGMLSMPTNAAVAQAVAQSKNSVGYVGLAFAKDFSAKGKVKILSISKKKDEAGMLPTDETVKSGKYPLFRYLYAYTLGAPKGLAAEFLKFGQSAEGQKLVVKEGYLPLK